MLVDAFAYFQGGRRVDSPLPEFARRHGAGHVPLGERLLAANAAGEPTRRKHDFHFNELGNELFAEALLEWIAAAAAASAETPPAAG